MNIAAYSLRERTVAWLACPVLLVGGYIAYQQLGRFEDPEFVIRQAVIVTPYPGALPAQVAEEVTDAIEGAVQQLQEVKEVTSVSTLGQSRVSVEIDLRFARTKDDLEQVWDKLRRKVADAQRLLPPGAGPSLVNNDFGDVYALFFAVTGDGYPLEQIRDYVEDLERELVLVLFMGLRSGLIVGAILLLTVAGTLIAMHLDGIAMQRISLGALIIALGMLVDNAIVVTDGILVRLQKGEERAWAAVEVVQATQWPLLGGTAVGILAFSAIGLSPTEMGEYAWSLFWVILYAMLLSWLLAVTLTPLFCVSFLKVKPADRAGVGSGSGSDSGLERYRRLLRVLLRRRLATGVGLLALLVAAVLGFGYVPPGFMPESARPQFVVDLFLPQGTDIEVTAAELAEVETHVRGKRGVTHVTSFVGQGGLRFMLTYVPEDPNSAYGQLLVDVEDAGLIAPLIAELQTELEARHPDVSIKVWKFMLGRGGGKKIEAAFRGPDPEVLRELAEQAKAVMAILGFLSLIGMLVKNAIVLVDQADAERRDGKAGLDAVLDAAVSRARPVFLGALTTILGVAPLLLDPFFKSMAVTILFGLAFATALTLVVVPLLYAALFRIQGPGRA